MFLRSDALKHTLIYFRLLSYRQALKNTLSPPSTRVRGLKGPTPPSPRYPTFTALTNLVLSRFRVADGVGLVENDPVPPDPHHSMHALPLGAGLCGGHGCGGEGLLTPTGAEVARQRVVGRDHLLNCSNQSVKVGIRCGSLNNLA